MLPGSDDELLPTSGILGGPLLLHAQEVSDGAAQKGVVPAANVQRRYVDVGMLVLDAQLFPVVVAAGMVQPVQEQMNQFFGGLIYRKDEVKHRCRTRLQARADALMMTTTTPLASLPNVVPTLALI